jgi:transposase
MKRHSPSLSQEPTIKLSDSQLRDLQRQLSSDSSRVRTRSLVLLLSHQGHSGEQISSLLGISRRMVSRTRTRWRQQKVSGLADAKRPGRPPKVDAAYLTELFRVVKKNPRTLGYIFARWTAPRLAEYMKQQTGIDLSDNWVSQLLRARDYVWRRTKRTIRNKQDPQKILQAQHELQKMKKTASARTRAANSGSEMA